MKVFAQIFYECTICYTVLHIQPLAMNIERNNNNIKGAVKKQSNENPGFTKK